MPTNFAPTYTSKRAILPLYTMANMAQTTTVMGPDSSNKDQSSLNYPPQLQPDADRMKWREDTRLWAMNIQACANGGDSRSKGTAACLGLTLYRSLESSMKEQVKEAVRCGELVLSPEENDDPKDQVEIVEKIIKIVAKDSPVDKVTRMVRLNTQVHECVRKDGESVKKYINRFKKPSLAYLNLVHAGQESSESQVFAMTLVINARLPAQTFSNLINSIINNATTKKRTITRIVMMKEGRMREILEILEGKQSTETTDKNGCIKTLKAAMHAQVPAEDEDASENYISLSDAIACLESAGIEEKDLQSAKMKTSSALLSNDRPNFNTHDRPPRYQPNSGYGRYNNYNNNYNNRYQNNRYRMGNHFNRNNDKGGKERTQGEEKDLREYIDQKRSGAKEEENPSKKQKNGTDAYFH